MNGCIMQAGSITMTSCSLEGTMYKTLRMATGCLAVLIISACNGMTDVSAHYSVTSSTSKDHLVVIVNGYERGQVSGGYGHFNAPLAVPTQSTTGPSEYSIVVGVTVVIKNIERGTISSDAWCQAGGKVTTRIRYEITEYHPEGEISCTSW